jgi:hypothetical protein
MQYLFALGLIGLLLLLMPSTWMHGDLTFISNKLRPLNSSNGIKIKNCVRLVLNLLRGLILAPATLGRVYVIGRVLLPL